MTQSDSNRLPFDRKVLTRFFSKIKVSTEHFYNGDPCWDWTANKNNKGYGMFCYAGKKRLAHRIAYEMFVETIPPTLRGDHLCRRPICVNPSHKEPVTHRENCLRGTGQSARNHSKTTCKRGHPLSGDNLYINPTNGSRGCRICVRVRRGKPEVPVPQVPITHCKRGHEFTPENTRIRKAGERSCKACCRERANRYYHEGRKSEPFAQKIRESRKAAGVRLRSLPFDHPRRVRARERANEYARQWRAKNKTVN